MRIFRTTSLCFFLSLALLVSITPQIEHSLTRVEAATPVKMFTKVVSVTSGAPRRVSTLLSSAGYTGTYYVTELSIRNQSAVDQYFGNSDVDNTTGAILHSGESYTWRSGDQQDPIDPSQIYLYTGTTGDASLTIRSR